MAAKFIPESWASERVPFPLALSRVTAPSVRFRRLSERVIAITANRFPFVSVRIVALMAEVILAFGDLDVAAIIRAEAAQDLKPKERRAGGSPR